MRKWHLPPTKSSICFQNANAKLHLVIGGVAAILVCNTGNRTAARLYYTLTAYLSDSCCVYRPSSSTSERTSWCRRLRQLCTTHTHACPHTFIPTQAGVCVDVYVWEGGGGGLSLGLGLGLRLCVCVCVCVVVGVRMPMSTSLWHLWRSFVSMCICWVMPVLCLLVRSGISLYVSSFPPACHQTHTQAHRQIRTRTHTHTHNHTHTRMA